MKVEKAVLSEILVNSILKAYESKIRVIALMELPSTRVDPNRLMQATEGYAKDIAAVIIEDLASYFPGELEVLDDSLDVSEADESDEG